jgi:hypothetical protein
MYELHADLGPDREQGGVGLGVLDIAGTLG